MPINRFCKCCSNIRVASISFINKYLIFYGRILVRRLGSVLSFFVFFPSSSAIITIIVTSLHNWWANRRARAENREQRTESAICKCDMRIEVVQEDFRMIVLWYNWTRISGWKLSSEWQNGKGAFACIYKWLAFRIYLFVLLGNFTIRMVSGSINKALRQVPIAYHLIEMLSKQGDRRRFAKQ